ncbi:TolC family protein [Tissierella creatinini]|nr:TolC family protein [Tissierella creatinini]TJX63879.1 TolC family protein [Soehngenia saccharolytica]
MKIKSKIIMALSFILAFSSSLPSYAGSGTVTISYEDIEELVLENNLQIKANKYSLDDMEEALDDMEDAEDDIRDLQRNIYDISDNLGQIQGPETDPAIGALIKATMVSLDISGNTLDMRMPNSADPEDQIRLAELNFELAEKKLINGAKELYVLYHQLNNNISQLEKNRELLARQLEKSKISYEYGLITTSTLNNLESSLREFDNNYNSLIKQRDLLILKFKTILGLEDEIQIGILPTADRIYVSKIDYQEDLEETIRNSMTIKIKKQELNNGDANKKRIENEVQLKENEIDVDLTNQYNLLNQKSNDLLLAENNLIRLKAEQFKGQIQFYAGNLTKSALDSLSNEVMKQESLIKMEESTLLKEIEKYKAMVDGMI